MLLIFFFFFGFHLPEDILTYFGCNKKRAHSIQFTWTNTQPASDLQPKKVAGKGHQKYLEIHGRTDHSNSANKNAPPPLPLLLPFSCEDTAKNRNGGGGSVFTEISVIPGSTHSPPPQKMLASMPSIISWSQSDTSLTWNHTRWAPSSYR